jgi:hypothetical protein
MILSGRGSGGGPAIGQLKPGLKGKCKGRPRKPLAEVYLQGRPVARHFVC